MVRCWVVQGHSKVACFFVTDFGFLGFGPKRTASGDQTFLLSGSNLPCVLRPAGEELELIGAYYVHSIMYGEGLHEDFGFHSHFYPGSAVGGSWDSSDSKVEPAE